MATKKEIELLDAYKAATEAYDKADKNLMRKLAAVERAQHAQEVAEFEFADAEQTQQEALNALLEGIER